MRSLVTCVGGFIGSRVVDRLLHDGHELIVIDNCRQGVMTWYRNFWHLMRKEKKIANRKEIERIGKWKKNV